MRDETALDNFTTCSSQLGRTLQPKQFKIPKRTGYSPNGL